MMSVWSGLGAQGGAWFSKQDGAVSGFFVVTQADGTRKRVKVTSPVRKTAPPTKG